MDDTEIMDISYDGVRVSNSCGRSFEVTYLLNYISYTPNSDKLQLKLISHFKVLSGKFSTCRQVYALAIGKSEKGFSDTMKAEEVTKRTLINLRKEGLHIRHMVMDAPKRAGEMNSMETNYWLNEI